MKIVVLGGGISTERHVSLVSGTSVCKALRSLGHKAIFVDMFLGLEDYEGSLEAAFDAPDGFCGSVAVERKAPDLDKPRLTRTGIIENSADIPAADANCRSLNTNIRTTVKQKNKQNTFSKIQMKDRAYVRSFGHISEQVYTYVWYNRIYGNEKNSSDTA